MIKGISSSLSDFFTLKLSVTWWPFWLASTSSASVSQSLLTHPGPSWASSELSGSFLAFFCPSGHAPHPALFCQHSVMVLRSLSQSRDFSLQQVSPKIG